MKITDYVEHFSGELAAFIQSKLDQIYPDEFILKYSSRHTGNGTERGWCICKKRAAFLPFFFRKRIAYFIEYSGKEPRSAVFFTIIDRQWLEVLQPVFENIEQEFNVSVNIGITNYFPSQLDY